MTPAQSRMARAALQLGFAILQARQGRAEHDFSPRSRKVSSRARSRPFEHALEKAGIEFIDGNKPGVRVK